MLIQDFLRALHVINTRFQQIIIRLKFKIKNNNLHHLNNYYKYNNNLNHSNNNYFIFHNLIIELN